MNLGEFRTAVNRRTGVAVDATALSEMVNEATQAVGEERDWPWADGVDTFTTSGASTPLPADWSRTRTVNVAGFEAKRINAADGDAFLEMEQRPSVYSYTIEEGELVLYPTPDTGTTVIHRYVREETTMNSDSDSPLMPERFHPAIVNYTASLVCDRTGDTAKAMAFRAEYERWLKRMNDGTSRSQQPARVRVRSGAGW